MSRYRRGRSALKQNYKITKTRIDCWCSQYKKWEDAPDWAREDLRDPHKYDPNTGRRIPKYHKKCPRCNGRRWVWEVRKALRYQCFGGPMNGEFHTWEEAKDEYTQYNRGVRAGATTAKAILVWDGAHIGEPK